MNQYGKDLTKKFHEQTKVDFKVLSLREFFCRRSIVEGNYRVPTTLGILLKK